MSSTCGMRLIAHLSHVIGLIPEARRAVPCTIGSDAPVTLGFLAHDYVRAPSAPPRTRSMHYADRRWITFDCFGTLVDWNSGFSALLRPFAGRHTRQT